MFDSLLDSVSKRVIKIHSVTDVAVKEAHQLAKVVANSEDRLKKADEAAEVVQEHLKAAADELGQLRAKLQEAENELQVARFQALETSAVMDTLENLAGNAAQFSQAASKDLLVAHDYRLFEQSATLLNEKDLRRGVWRLNEERVRLLAQLCQEFIAEAEGPKDE